MSAEIIALDGRRTMGQTPSPSESGDNLSVLFYYASGKIALAAAKLGEGRLTPVEAREIGRLAHTLQEETLQFLTGGSA